MSLLEAIVYCFLGIILYEISKCFFTYLAIRAHRGDHEQRQEDTPC